MRATSSLLLLLVTALAACGNRVPGDASDDPSRPSATSVPSVATTSPAIAVTARNEEVSTETYTFEYAYPAAAGAIAGVKARLDDDLAARKAEISSMAEENKATFEAENIPFNQHDYLKSWAVVTDIPAWLSLSADFSTYTGGAHPNHGFDALLWDKRAAVAREPADLFQSRQAFVDAVKPAFCKALDRERAKRRDGLGVEGFDDCIDPTETVVILGSSNRKAFDRIGFLIAPYIAGPYAEGAYEVTLPVTAAMIDRLKPEFRSSFVSGR